eukprot:403345928
MDKLAFGGSGDEELSTEMKIQQEFAGDNVLLNFVIQGKTDIFHQESFKQGLTFEWVKNKIAIALEVRYADLLLFYKGKRIPEPFCLVDLGVQTGETIEVQILEGAVIGLDAVRKQVELEIAQQDQE